MKKNWLLFLIVITNIFCQNELDKHVRKLISQLKSPDSAVKISALHSLSHLGKKASPAIPMMISLLKEPQSKVALKTLEAFIQLGDVAQPTCYELIKLLSVKNKKTVILTRKAFIAMKDKALPELLKNINHFSFVVRSHILYILGEIKSPDSRTFVIGKLDDESWQVRYAAIEALVKIGVKSASSQLSQRLFDSNLQVQVLAVKACGKIQPANRTFLEPMAKVFREKNSLVLRRAVLQSLINMKVTSREIDKLLAKSLRIKKLQKLAITAIGKMEDMRMVKKTIPFLQSDDSDLKIATIDSIGNLEERATPFINKLIVMTTDGNKKVRMHTANAIGKIGPQIAAFAMPSLLSLLEDTESEVQTYAAIALGKMGKNVIVILEDIVVKKPRLRSHASYALAQIGKNSIPALIRLLEKHDKSVKFYAAEALGRIEDNSVELAIPALIKALQQQKNKKQFVDVLGKIGGNATKELIPLLAHKKWQVRKAAADALVLIGPAVIPLLSQTINHSNKYIALYSISIVGRLEEDAKSLVPVLANAYENTDIEIKKNVVIALGQIQDSRGMIVINDALSRPNLCKEALLSAEKMADKATEKTIDHLNTIVKTQDLYMRKIAARTLSKIGKNAVETLIETLKTGDRAAKAFAVIALGNIGHHAEQAATPLLNVLNTTKDIALKENIMHALVSIKAQIKLTMMTLQTFLTAKEPRLKRTAIVAIGKMGEVGAVYIPKFLYEAEQSPKELRNTVIIAIAEMGEKALPYIIPFLKNKKMFHREVIAAAIGNMGEEAYKALPFLVSALEKSTGGAQKEIIRAIKNIGKKGAFTIPTLSVFLRHKDWQVRELSAEAIGVMGKNAEIAIPVLLPLLGDVSWPVRNMVSETLAKIGGQTTVFGLITTLKKPFTEMRVHALITLKDLGKEAHSAVDEILEVLQNDTSIRVRSNAIYALGEIAPRETKVRQVLVKLLNDKNWQVRQAISFVLKKERD
ncbi:HEAT repeat domain-containing protein [Candidatus Uabimicrobium sp. HlEnr_7]|uniref:HEAT repeat domain-containing protein n=1 Tax=Candidatus Uabimicrobium helgolandensis TaxID=3095367 RepID=UPI003557A62F